jgi:hypothetical protein
VRSTEPVHAHCLGRAKLVILLNHHPQQIRDPIRGDVDVLAGLRAEAIVPILGGQEIARVYEFTESFVHEARRAATRAGASLSSQGYCPRNLSTEEFQPN